MGLRVLRSKKAYVVLRNLIVSEIVAYGTFMVLALSADWGEAYQNLAVSDYIRFEVIEFFLLGIVQLGLIVFVFSRSLVEEKDISEIVKTGEHEKVEFKTSLRWDMKRGQVNKELERTIMKTVAAFLNSEGGHLVIGVNDRGEPVGLEKDFASLVRQDTDGFENHFNNLFNQMIGPEYRRQVKLTFDNFDGKTVCLVKIEPSHKPVYLRTDGGEDFYVRTGNVTTPLKMSEAATYVSSWWRAR